MMAATQELCQHFFPDTIEVAIGENEAAGIRKKPAPDTVFAALNALNALGSPRQSSAVYVGDSDVDIETARHAGIPCISVLWGFRDRDFLIKHGAKTFISAPSELLSL
jgi:phosphoglycolate phosphatase